MRTPSLEEKIRVYEALLHQIQLHRSVTLNREKLLNLLDKIDRWSYAHRVGNGALSDEQQQAKIDSAFWELENLS